MKTLFLFLAFCGLTKAQILADFETNIPIPGTQNFKTFTAQLNHEQAPIATANFMLLAGLEDEEWLGPIGDTFPAPHLPYSPLRPGRVYQLPGRVALNIVYQEANETIPGDVGKYIVRQATTVFAILNAAPVGDSYQSLTGPNPVSLVYDAENKRYKIVIKYERDWLDPRFGSIRRVPLYRNIPITRIEPGLRFISGSFENDVSANPGYTFQDELVARVINSNNPWRTQFNDGWVLGMDSPGHNANGSRFFISAQTSAQNIPTFKSWNRRYTSFGHVLTAGNGRVTVNEIMNYAVTPEGVPKGSLVIKKITFRRIGTNEVGFFPHLVLAELPGPLQSLPLDIERTGFNTFFLNSPATPKAQRTFLSATELGRPPFLFSSFGKPGELERNRENISTIVQSQPRGFFTTFVSRLPTWPSQDYDFSNRQITFTRVSSSGVPSGQVQLNFGAGTGEQEGTFGTYTLQLPALSFDLGEGNIRNEPPLNMTGTFTSELTDDANPYQAKIKILTSTHELPMNEFVLDFDLDRSRDLQIRLSRFVTLNTEDPVYSFEGYWRQTAN
ncbi:MAG: peptidylprolyl isomerase [Akkermansiaceae bacterium]